jgi:hypothetical protein
MKLEFSQQIFQKNIQMPNLEKIRPVAVELVHAHLLTDRQTDITKLIVAFRNFAKGPKNGLQTINDKAIHNKKLTFLVNFFGPSPPFRRHLKIPVYSTEERLSVVAIFLSRTVLVPSSSRLQSVLQNIRNFPFTLKLTAERNEAIGDEGAVMCNKMYLLPELGCGEGAFWVI